MRSGIITLLGAGGSTKLCIEGTLKDGAAKEGVVSVLVIGRIDGIVAVGLSRPVAGHTGHCVAQISVGASDGDYKLLTRLTSVHRVPRGHRAAP